MRGLMLWFLLSYLVVVWVWFDVWFHLFLLFLFFFFCFFSGIEGKCDARFLFIKFADIQPRMIDTGNNNMKAIHS